MQQTYQLNFFSEKNNTTQRLDQIFFLSATRSNKYNK